MDGDVKLSQTEQIEFLKDNRFKTGICFMSDDIEAIIAKIQEVDRASLDFAIDGMVIKVNDPAARVAIGYTDKFPKWAIAYKFEAEETTTLLKDVAWQVGRTGKLTPLALLEPVELCGATVKRATLNNYGDICRKDVTIGSRVFVRRSNDVIPEILGVAVPAENAETPPKPTQCPGCGSEYRYPPEKSPWRKDFQPDGTGKLHLSVRHTQRHLPGSRAFRRHRQDCPVQ